MHCQIELTFDFYTSQQHSLLPPAHVAKQEQWRICDREHSPLLFTEKPAYVLAQTEIDINLLRQSVRERASGGQSFLHNMKFQLGAPTARSREK
jgi:hypothetical protein